VEELLKKNNGRIQIFTLATLNISPLGVMIMPLGGVFKLADEPALVCKISNRT